jgi:threonine dehydrogenase-like Zn-dependent dehydrogenase
MTANDATATGPATAASGRLEPGKLGDHAVVLGASMAGLLAARVLADAYRQVTVIERDPLPESAADRKGVPQGQHVHELLPRGTQILGELFSGLLVDLTASGVPELRAPQEFRFVFGGHLLARTANPVSRCTRRAGPFWKAMSAAGSGPWPTCRSGTGAR